EQLADVLALVERRYDNQRLVQLGSPSGGCPASEAARLWLLIPPGARRRKAENRRGERAGWTADGDDVSTLHDRMAPLCPVCRSAAAHVRYRLPRYSIFRCAACTQAYLWPLPSPEDVRATFAMLYTSGEGSVPELKSY